MNFLVPMAWSALLLAIPVIAFYLVKTRLRRRPVSTSLFWHQLSPQVYNTSLWRKLRRWVSLFLQLLFLAALVFALAQPLATWQSLQPASLVIVLDPSASMEATDIAPSRWDRAVQLASQRISQMRIFDEAILIVAADAPQVLNNWTGSKRSLQRALAEARLSNRDTDIRAALELARNLAADRTQGKVVLFSDGAWSQSPAKENFAGIEPIWLGGEAVNTGITLFSARRAFSGPGEFQLAARVEGRGTGPVAGRVEIFRDGRVMDVQSFTLLPGQPWEHTWTGRSDRAARFEAKLMGFPTDVLARDDAAVALLPAQSSVKVQLVAPANGFLDAALQATTGVDWKRVWPAEALGAAEPHTLYVFYRSVPPAGFAADASLLIDPTASGYWGELRGLLDRPMVSDLPKESPLLRHAGIEKVNLENAREFSPAAGAEVFAESFGKPLIFGQWSSSRRWLVLPFDLEGSDLVLRTAFPILLGNVVESLRQETAVATVDPLPGSVETRLARTMETVAHETPAAADAGIRVAWWSGFPLWWWAAAFGSCWLLGEWWLFTRRITE